MVFVERVHSTSDHWQVPLFSGQDYWNGLLDWTTGLTQTAIKSLFTVGQTCSFILFFAYVGSLAG